MRGNKVEFEQGSTEWLWKRINLFTASEVSTLVWEQKTLKDGTLSSVKTGYDAALKYINEKVAGNFLTALPEEVNAKALDWGKFWENDARCEFLALKEIDAALVETKSAYFDKENLLLVSPDGLATNNEFGIEIKCPITLSNFACAKLNVKDGNSLKEYNAKYYWQVMANLYVTGAKKWYFVNYHPYIEVEKRFGVAEIYPDKEAFDLLEARLKWAVSEYKSLLNKWEL